MQVKEWRSNTANARRAVECGSEAAALLPVFQGCRFAAALQGAFGTNNFTAVANSCGRPSNARFATVRCFCVADFLSPSRPSPCDSGSSVRFRELRRFLLILGPERCQFALKTSIICSIQKSDVLCFQGLLSFVPTVFVFPCDLRGFTHSGNFAFCCILGVPDLRRNADSAKKLEFCVKCAHCALNLSSF